MGLKPLSKTDHIRIFLTLNTICLGQNFVSLCEENRTKTTHGREQYLPNRAKLASFCGPAAATRKLPTASTCRSEAMASLVQDYQNHSCSVRLPVGPFCVISSLFFFLMMTARSCLQSGFQNPHSLCFRYRLRYRQERPEHHQGLSLRLQQSVISHDQCVCP